MKLMKAMLLALALVASSACVAQDDARAEAERLLVELNMEQTLNQVMDAALDAQISQKPELAPYRGVLQAFFQKYMNFQTLKADIVEMYAAEFTAAELADLRRFYSTPTGKKAIQKIPQIAARSLQIASDRVDRHKDDLERMIREERMRIEAGESEPKK